MRILIVSAIALIYSVVDAGTTPIDISTLGSHNSYHRAPHPTLPELNYTHLPIIDQLNLYHVRAFEFDIASDNDTDLNMTFRPEHIPVYDEGTVCDTLDECITDICDFLDTHSNEPPIYMFFQNVYTDEQMVALDELIISICGVKLVGPEDVANMLPNVTAPTNELEAYGLMYRNGWPDIYQLRGKIIYCHSYKPGNDTISLKRFYRMDTQSAINWILNHGGPEKDNTPKFMIASLPDPIYNDDNTCELDNLWATAVLFRKYKIMSVGRADYPETLYWPQTELNNEMIRRQYFDFMDRNGDGQVDVTELRNILTIFAGGRLSNDELNTILTGYDIICSGDTAVCMDNIFKFIQKHADHIDHLFGHGLADFPPHEDDFYGPADMQKIKTYMMQRVQPNIVFTDHYKPLPEGSELYNFNFPSNCGFLCITPQTDGDSCNEFTMSSNCTRITLNMTAEQPDPSNFELQNCDKCFEKGFMCLFPLWTEILIVVFAGLALLILIGGCIYCYRKRRKDDQWDRELGQGAPTTYTQA